MANVTFVVVNLLGTCCSIACMYCSFSPSSNTKLSTVIIFNTLARKLCFIPPPPPQPPNYSPPPFPSQLGIRKKPNGVVEVQAL